MRKTNALTLPSPLESPLPPFSFLFEGVVSIYLSIWITISSNCANCTYDSLNTCFAGTRPSTHRSGGVPAKQRDFVSGRPGFDHSILCQPSQAGPCRSTRCFDHITPQIMFWNSPLQKKKGYIFMQYLKQTPPQKIKYCARADAPSGRRMVYTQKWIQIAMF